MGWIRGVSWMGWIQRSLQDRQDSEELVGWVGFRIVRQDVLDLDEMGRIGWIHCKQIGELTDANFYKKTCEHPKHFHI